MKTLLVLALSLAPLAAHAAPKTLSAPTVAQTQKLAATRYPSATIVVGQDITASGQPAMRTKTIAGEKVQGRLVAVEPKSNSATPFIQYATKAKSKSGAPIFFGKYSGDL